MGKTLEIFIVIVIGILLGTLLVPFLEKNESREKPEEQQVLEERTMPTKETVNKNLANAVFEKNLYGVREAFKNGADVNTTTVVTSPSGKKVPVPLFMIVVAAKDITIIKLFLEHGVNLEAKGAEGETALIHAVFTGEPEIVKLLVKDGANVNAPTLRGNTPLMAAADESLPSIIQFLLENGADKSLKNNRGQQAIDFAKQSGNTDATELLR